MEIPCLFATDQTESPDTTVYVELLLVVVLTEEALVLVLLLTVAPPPAFPEAGVSYLVKPYCWITAFKEDA